MYIATYFSIPLSRLWTVGYTHTHTHIKYPVWLKNMMQSTRRAPPLHRSYNHSHI